MNKKTSTIDGNKFAFCEECGGTTVHLFLEGQYHCVRHDPIAKKNIEEYKGRHPPSEFEELQKRRVKCIENSQKENNSK